MKEEKKCCCHEHDEQKEHSHAVTSCCGEEEVHTHNDSCCGESEPTNTYKPTIIKLAISLVSLIISLVLSKTLMNISMFFHYVNVAWVSLIICGIPIVKSALKSLKNKKITSMLLVTVAMLSSIILEILNLTGVAESSAHAHSYIFAAGEIAFLVTLGRTLESYTVSRSRKGIEKLINLTPKMATVEVFGMPMAINAKSLRVNDIVVVKPGEMIPIDGEIIFGKTSVDESNMTGESIPVDKKIGDKVFGGTINTIGVIKVKALTNAKDMQLSKLIKLVEEAEGKKAPIAKLADKWATYVIPSAIALAFLITIITSFFVPFIEAFTRGVTILCVFCPCSLVLATPTAIAAGLGAGTKHGILIKNGTALETLSHVSVMAFDKTGTITEGKIEVKDIDIENNELLSYIYSLEKYSEHPIAKAIVDFAKKNNVSEVGIENAKALVGSGIEGNINGKKVLAVKYDDISKYAKTNKYENKGKEKLEKGFTVIALIIDEEVKGIVSLLDTIKADAKNTISEIKDLNIKTLILTGDNKFASENISREVGINETYSSLLPDEKLRKIEEIQKEGNVVCMVGDGVNDAPSLAAASTSIAFAKLGNDVAIEAADVSLLNDNIKKIPVLLRLSRSVLNTIRFNIWFGLFVNIASTFLSAFGLIDPVAGALIHNCTSVFVVGNSSLLLTRNYEKKYN